MSTHAVCPGSFDPPTLGHLDVIGRAAALFGTVTVAVLVNPAKSGLFDLAARQELLTTLVARWPNVRVDSFSGLLVDYCRQVDAGVIVKGVRGPGDVEYETPMAQMNRSLTGIDTVFLTTSPDLGFVSSSLVKQVAGLGGDVSAYVPAEVAAALAARLSG